MQKRTNANKKLQSEISRELFADCCLRSMSRKRRNGNRHWVGTSDNIIAMVAERMAAKYHA